MIMRFVTLFLCRLKSLSCPRMRYSERHSWRMILFLSFKRYLCRCLPIISVWALRIRAFSVDPFSWILFCDKKWRSLRLFSHLDLNDWKTWAFKNFDMAITATSKCRSYWSLWKQSYLHSLRDYFARKSDETSFIMPSWVVLISRRFLCLCKAIIAIFFRWVLCLALKCS
jgi:hypothetical protein